MAAPAVSGCLALCAAKTLCAAKRSLLGLLLMDFHVATTLVRAREATRTDLALERFLAGVRPNVRGQVVGAGEVSQTDLTLKRFLAGVRSHMTGELVGAREPPLAALCRAAVGAFVRRGRSAARFGRRHPTTTSLLSLERRPGDRRVLLKGAAKRERDGRRLRNNVRRLQIRDHLRRFQVQKLSSRRCACARRRRSVSEQRPVLHSRDSNKGRVGVLRDEALLQSRLCKLSRPEGVCETESCTPLLARSTVLVHAPREPTRSANPSKATGCALGGVETAISWLALASRCRALSLSTACWRRSLGESTFVLLQLVDWSSERKNAA